MRTELTLREVCLIGLIGLVSVACGGAANPSAAGSPSSGGPSAPSSGTPSTPSAPSSAAPSAAGSPSSSMPQAWLLVGRTGDARRSLILSTTAEVGLDLPAGTPREAWSRIATITPDGDATIVRDLIVQPGFGGPEALVPGRWRLPTIGPDPVPVGRSIDGSTIALVEDAAGTMAGRRISRFAILEHHVQDQPTRAGDAPLRLLRIIELRGAFEYDALSPDGRILYVIEHLDAAAGGAYQVRAVDVASGLMRDAVIVDKANPDERMAGSAIAQMRRADGLVLTLYDGPEHPFVHALNSIDAWAICIDLPSGSGSAGTAGGGGGWDLAASGDGSAVYAASAGAGIIVEIDPRKLSVGRSAILPTTASGPSVVLAKFGHGEVGPIGRTLVVSADGALLFAAGRNGMLAIRTDDLVAVRRDLAGTRIDALGLTPDGTTLFALVRDGGRIVAVEAATGRFLGTVPGSGYDQLLAVAPW
ncbi:MAG TPA: hypothetical protein VM427_09280 [Patescibacteria group bacterium]|nr:hypothetical protein [Patescibacteria group bacterium]